MIRDIIPFLLTHGSALLPSAGDLAGCAALAVVVAGLACLGAALRLLCGGADAVASADLVVGWAAAVLVLVLGGTLFGLALTPLALGLALAALASVGLLIRRREMPMGPGLGWLLLLLVPVLALTASMQPSEGDDFGTWLPNLRYLALFDHFPGAGLPVSDSQFPAYPPAGTLVGYLTSRLSGALAETAANRFNLLLLAALALLLIEVWRQAAASIRAPGIRAVALALAATTLASPTFVPRLVLANYAETATAVALAFSALLGLRLVLSEQRPGRGLAVQTALLFALLLLTKQSTQALFALLSLSLGLLALQAGGWRRSVRLLPALLAGLAMLLVWKHQVAVLGGGEMRIAPWSQWQWDGLPETLESMGTVIRNKLGYFASSAVLLVSGLVLLVRRRPAPALTVIPLYAMLFLGFTLFLTWTYLAVFFGYESRSAASFWRYNTQIGPVELLALAALIGAGWRRWGDRPAMRRLPALAGGLAIVGLVAGPVLAAPVLRFDINPVKHHIAVTVTEMRPLLPEGAKIWYLDPPRVGLSNEIDYYLGFGMQIAGMISYFVEENLYRPALDSGRAGFAYVLNATPALEAAVGLSLPEGASYLIAQDGPGQWHIVRPWPFNGFASARDIKY